MANILRGLSSHSFPGPDALPNIFLKEGCFSLIWPIVRFFKELLQRGVLPAEWKLGTVIPIYKKGSRFDCCNYRPVTLTCTLCKVFERVVKDEIQNYLLTNNILNTSQYGFLPKRSCQSALMMFLEEVTSAVDNGRCVDVVHLDLAKAFDSVPHKRLLWKLMSAGIGGPLLKIINSFLTDRYQSVRVGDLQSAPIRVESGVPQGSVLGPLLFLLYINDVDDCLSNSKLYKFADDMKLVLNFPRTTVVIQSQQLMQNDLSSIFEWCSKWLLKINPSKCACMHFGRNNPHMSYCIGGIAISACKECVGLGVLITANLKPSAQCLRIANKAQKMLSIIKLAFRALDIKSFTLLYKAFVLPLLDYCSTVWNPFYVKDIEVLEKVQRRFTRILPIYRELSYRERLEKYNLHSLFARRLYSDLVTVFKIVHGHIDIDSSKLFTFEVDSRTRGHNFKIREVYAHLDTRKYWFSVRIVPAWNALPYSAVNAASVQVFKSELRSHFSMIGLT